MKNETKCPKCGTEGVVHDSGPTKRYPCGSLYEHFRGDDSEFTQSDICAAIQAIKKENEEVDKLEVDQVHICKGRKRSIQMGVAIRRQNDLIMMSIGRTALATIGPVFCPHCGVKIERRTS